MQDLQIEEFRVFVNKVLPTVYNDALTYSELLNKVLHHLNNTIDQVNLLSQNMDIGLNQISEIEASGIKSIQGGLDEIETAIATIYDKVSQEQHDEVLVQLGEIENIQLPQKANKVQEEWITPTLLNGWINYAGVDLQYYKDSLNEVIFKGLIHRGSALHTIIINLPLGYRPDKSRIFILSNGNTGFCRVEVNPDGTVYFRNGSIAINVATSFDQLKFKAV